jgi:hypothetical protein
MTALSRRHLLGLGAGLAGGLLLPRARAGRGDTPCSLIVVTALGGWDVSYTIDPKPGSPLVDGPELDEDGADDQDREVVRSYGALDVITNPVKRPALDAFFSDWADRTLLVRGLWIGSISHDACATRVLTGQLADGLPDLGALVADAVGRDAAIPYMDLGGASRAGALAAITGRAGRSNQLRHLLDRRTALDAPAGSDIRFPQYIPAPAARADIATWQAARAEAFAARWGGRPGGDAHIADLTEAHARAARLRDEGGRLARQLGQGNAATLNAQVDTALDLLSSGLAHTALIDSGVDWDTHDNNQDQHAHWQTLFNGLQRLATGLDAEGLLDRTTVVVVSEMTRTPRRNAVGGKDHWPVTAAMAFGGPVRGGRVLGASDDGLDALPINLRTGLSDAAGVPLRYDHFIAGLLQAHGGDAARWFPGVTPLGGLT